MINHLNKKTRLKEKFEDFAENFFTQNLKISWVRVVLNQMRKKKKL